MPLIRFQSDIPNYPEVYHNTLRFKGYPAWEQGATPQPNTGTQVVGYWHNASPAYSTLLTAVPTAYDVIIVAYAYPATANSAVVQFTPNASLYASQAAFIADVQAQQASGKSVFLAIGGVGRQINLSTTAWRDEFVTSVVSLVNTYGFDGIDLAFEAGDVLLRIAGDNDFQNPTSPAITNAIYAVQQIYTQTGCAVSLTGQTLHIQAGHTLYANATDRAQGSLLPLIYGLRDILSWVTTQCYNSPDRYDRNNVLRTNGASATDAQRADFAVAMQDMLLAGFTVEGGSVSVGGEAYRSSTTLLQEDFTDNSLSARGWYDGTSGTVIDAGTLSMTFNSGATTAGFGAKRHAFTATDEVYVTLKNRFSSNWVGSGLSYHPHLYHLLGTADGAYTGFSQTHLTLYIEPHGALTYKFQITDGLNISGNGGTGDVAGCGSLPAGADAGDTTDCYQAGGAWFNERTWDTGAISGLTSWHTVEMYAKMNTAGVADGVLKLWVDGTLAIDKSHMVYRTSAYPTMAWNQFAIAPYIGDGSPVTQTVWMDDLVVAVGQDGSAGGGVVQSFPALSPRQVQMGLGTTQSVVNSGYLTAGTAEVAIRYILDGTTYTGRGYTASAVFSTWRGIALWTTNYDSANTPAYDYGSTLAQYLEALAGGGGTEPPPPPPDGEYLQTIYASTTGSANGPGTITNPYTIGAGLAAVQPGTRLFVRGGTYSVTPTAWNDPGFKPGRSGTGTTRQTRITIQNYPGETVVFAPTGSGPAFGVYGQNYVVWDGFTINSGGRAGVAIEEGDYVTIRNCHIQGITEGSLTNCDGVWVERANYPTVEYCTLNNITNGGSFNACGIEVYASQNGVFRYNNIYSVSGCGIFLKENASPRIANCHSYRNYIHGIGYNGFYILGDAQNSQVYESLFIGNGTHVHISGDTDGAVAAGTLIARNTIANGTDGIRLGSAEGDNQTGVQVYDNIIERVSGYDIITMINPPSGWITYWNYNRYHRLTGAFIAQIGRYAGNEQRMNFSQWQGLGYDANGGTSDPGFTDYANNDYRLLTTSNARGVGRYGGDLGCYASTYWLPQCGAGFGPEI